MLDQRSYPLYRFLKNLHLTPPFFSHRIEIALHSILACRLMIGIREASHHERKLEAFELSAVPRDSTLEFARRTSGENTWIDPQIYVGPSKA